MDPLFSRYKGSRARMVKLGKGLRRQLGGKVSQAHGIYSYLSANFDITKHVIMHYFY